VALTTVAICRLVPTLSNPAKVSTAWLELLIAGADSAIKSYCKQELELAAYDELHSGNEHPNLVLTQRPVWSGRTTIAAGSDGAVLPQATIHVASTQDAAGNSSFDPAGRATGLDPSICVQTGSNSWTVVTYTGVTATSFTGCSGGTGMLSSTAGLNGVSQPVVNIDFQGQWDQRPLSGTSDAGPFGPQTLQVNGVNFAVNLNRDGTKSNSGLLTRVGGYAAGGWIGSFPNSFGDRGKLAAGRLPCWPRGSGNIKVRYSAGYETVPADLQYAATTLVGQLMRQQLSGWPLQSESLGAYSYSILTNSQDPDIGQIRSILSRYKEMSW
jgi:hypothetical protein